MNTNNTFLRRIWCAAFHEKHHVVAIVTNEVYACECGRCRRHWFIKRHVTTPPPATPPERAAFLAACGRVGEAIRTKL